MTRKEGIEVINNHIEHWERLLREKICDETDGVETINAFNMAITALEQTDDDCVSRADALKCFTWTNTKDDVFYAIKALPSVQPMREKGEWIPMFDRWGDIVTTVCGYECSKCGEWNADNDKFCPNCGADMSGKETVNESKE